MIRDAHPLVQATLGGLLTWGLTALGAATVAITRSQNKKLLDASLGFAAGVMTAASFWSLLAPGIERAQEQMTASEWPVWLACIPVAVGFAVGATFVFLAEKVLPWLGFSSDDIVAAFIANQAPPEREPSARTSDQIEMQLRRYKHNSHSNEVYETPAYLQTMLSSTLAFMRWVVVLLSKPLNQSALSPRSSPETSDATESRQGMVNNVDQEKAHHEHIQMMALSWKRVILLIVAITVHNIPEGLAVGVGFGAVNKTKEATFHNAVSLAIGIGIQNFPEGMAVSLPLVGFGYSKWRAFLYGQLSGVVEPIAAVIGAAIVTAAEPILPYALCFAAGAMIYVVFDDIIPEAQMHGNGRLASIAAVIGFIIMMSLDVGLG